MSWRDHLKVHPACKLFDRLPAHELQTLGEDIKRNGLWEKIKYIDAVGDGDPQDFFVVDGQNRLDAMEKAGMQVVDDRGINWDYFEELRLDTNAEIVDYVISANILRRHLDDKNKERLITEVIKLDPTRSNRQIARQTDSSPTTVGKVRDKVEVAGDVSTVDTRTDTKGRRQPSRKKTKRSRKRPGVPGWNEPIGELPEPTVPDAKPESDTPEQMAEERNPAPSHDAGEIELPTDSVTEKWVSWIVTCLQNAIDAKSPSTALMHLNWAANGLARDGCDLFALLNVPPLKKQDPESAGANSSDTPNQESGASSPEGSAVAMKAKFASMEAAEAAE
jgi:hypothetical protein